MNTQSITQPRATRLGRLTDYLGEMFPPKVRIPLNLLNFGVVYFGLHAIEGRDGFPVSWRVLVGALTVQLLWLFIRVYDELKDAESDLELARAGDKRFIYRPLVTGRVTLADISALRWWMTLAICAINLVFGDWLMAVGLLVGFGYISLAYKWFFYPAMRDNIIVVYFTHLPNVLAIEIYTLFIYASEFGMPSLMPAVALLLAPWLTVGAYEFAYKIRLPEDETEYMTYSKVLGWRLATWVAILLLAVSTVCYLVVMHVANIAVWVQYAIAGTSALAIGACIRLLILPIRAHANLTRYTGLYWYVSTLSITVGAIVGRL